MSLEPLNKKWTNGSFDLWEDSEVVASGRAEALQTSGPLGAMTQQRVSPLLEAFGSSFTSP